MTRRIHVVGSSPRTGTTLMAELLRVGFEIDAHAEHERSIFRPPPAGCDTYLSKDPVDVLSAAALLAIDPELWIVHMVRDPRDVVVSRHSRDPEAYWTTLALWHFFRAGARRAEGSPRFLTVRYEDLVRDPQGAQDDLAAFLPFLKRRAPFDEFAGRAEPPPRSVEALGGLRPVDAASIGVWRQHKPRVLAQLERHAPIDRDLEELGYETDSQWKREFEGVVPDNGRSHLGERVPLHRRARLALRRRRRITRYRRQLRGAGTERKRSRTPRARPGPFQIEVLRERGRKLEVGTLGRGEPVLLLPGLGLPGTEEFGPVAHALVRAGFRALTFNPRGVGRSRGRLQGLTLHDWSDDAALVLAHLAPDTPAHVIGRGYGNRVARCLAADHPERVRSVTLLAAGGAVPPTKRRNAPAAARRRRRWPRVRQAQKAASYATPLADWWDGGSAPLLVIQGLDDTTAPPENGRRLARSHPERVRLVELEGADHELLAKRLEDVLPPLLDFLGGEGEP